MRRGRMCWARANGLWVWVIFFPLNSLDPKPWWFNFCFSFLSKKLIQSSNFLIATKKENRTKWHNFRLNTNLLISFWGDALLTTTYVLNHLPSKSVATTAYELWYGTSHPYTTYAHGVWLVTCITQPTSMVNLIQELPRWCSEGIPKIPKGMWCVGNIQMVAWWKLILTMLISLRMSS